MGTGTVPAILLWATLAVACCHPSPAPTPSSLAVPPPPDAGRTSEPAASPDAQEASSSAVSAVPEQRPLGAPASCDTAPKARIGTQTIPASMTSCSANADCIVVSERCCPCGHVNRLRVAINARSADAYHRRVCGPKPGRPCPACMPAPDTDLLATCASGRCALVDLLTTPLTECSADADCRLRTKNCCESGASTGYRDYVAVRTGQESLFASYRCDPDTVCPGGEPARPVSGSAQCRCSRCVFKW